MKKKFWIKTRILLWFWLFIIAVINIFLYFFYLLTEKSFINSIKTNIEKNYESIKKTLDNQEWYIINIPSKDLDEIKSLGLFIHLWKEDQEIMKNYNLWYYFYWDNIIFRWDYKWYNILIWKNISDFLSYKSKILELMLFADFLWVIIIVMMIYFITNRLLRPLLNLSKYISKYDIEKDKSLVKNNYWDSEIWLITDAINNLISKSKSILESQKRFIQDSNHELKTPLMQIDTNIEILEEKITDKNILKKLENIKKSTENINKIVSNLWFILREENKSYSLEKINIKNYIENLVKNFDNLLQEKNISINIISYFDLELENNTYFLDRLFWNLIQNSISYNKWNSKIDIEIFENKIILKDEGIWIQKSELENIFNRFYRNQDSCIYNKEWNWLWLTIVKKICDDFSWKINVDSKIWVWSKFEIIFKD